MRTAVAECHSVDEITLIRNKAEAYRYALKQAKESPEVIRKAEEIKLRAERRAGELLKETIRKPEEGRPVEVSKGTTLIDMGISRDQSSKWQKIADIPEDKFENYLEVEKELSTAGAIRVSKQLEREEKIEAIKSSNPETPDGIYQVLYADPPWKYSDVMNDRGSGGFGVPGGASFHYPTMTIDELCSLKIDEISDDNSVLFLWVTSPFLEDSFKIINSWGFKYKSSFVWDKVKHNMGHYNSVRHEFLLICTKGSFTPQIKILHDSVVTQERTKHSEKPEVFRQIIDEIYPRGNRIELFARKKTDNWDVYGNQI